MFHNDHLTQRRINRKLAREEQAQFDAVNAQKAAESIEFDPINERMAVHATTQMRLAALQVVLNLAAILSEVDVEDDEIDMLPSELLDSLMLEVFAEDEDDDDDEIDYTVKAVLSAHISDALSSLGVDDDLIDDVFDTDIDVADAAIESAAEIALENMPDDDELEEFVALFAYGDEATFDAMFDCRETQFDAVTLTRGGQGTPGKRPRHAGQKTTKEVNGHKIVYKAVKAIRNGKKVIINKRVSGDIVLSSKQKAALRKARTKAHTGSAVRKQIRSLNKGISMKLYNMTEGQKKGLTRAGEKRLSKYGK